MSEIRLHHFTNLREIIESHVREHFEINEFEMARSMRQYINNQIYTIFDAMITAVPYDNIMHPDIVSPINPPDDYYKKAIEQYGTIFTDLPN